MKNTLSESFGKIATNLTNSFDNNSKSFSARKLTSFAYLLLVLLLHFVLLYKMQGELLKSLLYEFLVIDSLMILSLLSVITTQKLIDKYLDTKGTNTTTTNTTNGREYTEQSTDQ